MTAPIATPHAVGRTTTLLVALALAALPAAGPAPAAADPVAGRIGPGLALTPMGRKLDPVGRLTQLGNFSAGGALTPDGRFYWAVDAGNGFNDIKVVELSTGAVIQDLPLPGGSGGIAFAPDGRHAYVSGTPAGGPKPRGPTKGSSGDVVHVFSVAAGRGTEGDPVALPAVSGSGDMNSVPPTKGDYPQGIAVSPDGSSIAVALTLSGAVALVDLRSGAVRTVNVGAYPFAAVFSPDGGKVYVSNQQDGTISVVDVAAGRQDATIGVGGPSGNQGAHPEGLAIDRRGDRLFVAVSSRDAIAVVDTRQARLAAMYPVARPEGVGTEPTALALAPDEQTIYAADSNEDAIVAVALTDRPASAASSPARTVLRAPSARAIATYLRVRRAARSRLRAAGRGQRLSARRRYRRTVLRARRRYLASRRVQACAGPSAGDVRTYVRAVRRALALRTRALRRSALGQAQGQLAPIEPCPAVAGFIPGLRPGDVIGRMPTAWYPTDVAVTHDGARLVWLAGLGYGAGPNPLNSFYGTTPYGQYIQDMFMGVAGVTARPTDQAFRALSARADASVRPANPASPPPGTPVRAGGPIKHVFYIVKENRVYDQIFGSDPRGDGAPQLELFDDNGVPGPTGGVTPNAHALTRIFPLLDHVYSDSQVSNDGHVITSAAYANDYVIREVQARSRGLDEGVFPVSFPPNDFVFDQAVRQGISFRIYGEESGGTSPFANDGRPTYSQVVANSVAPYPGNVQIDCLGGTPFPGSGAATCARDSGVLGSTNGTVVGTNPPATSRFQTFQADFEHELAAGNVPAFNYLILPNDHTNGTRTNARTPKALVADNDLGLGQIVQEISQSSIWSQSAIIVVEDDSQDGADHVDAHRQPAYVISPYARLGAVVHTRYDQYSALRTAEILAGLQPLNLNDALATPMYDAFISGSQQPNVDGTRYTAIQPQQSLSQVNGATAADARLSNAMPFDILDAVPQAVMDRVLWHSVYGERSRPPAAGPGASAAEHARALGAMRVYRAGRNVRSFLVHGPSHETR
ncbi:MAG TPA: alkaline phosphatase family protein [Solirubrobacteraceae bacterium]|jgi:YVTN family beta-propeller protein|nr:alkaline phosphatase family protein [Solirubrobacteraceae bacterium]